MQKRSRREGEVLRAGSEHENRYVKAQRENTEETLEGLTLCNGGKIRPLGEGGSSSAAMQTKRSPVKTTTHPQNTAYVTGQIYSFY